jgi:hypothetical protein
MVLPFDDVDCDALLQQLHQQIHQSLPGERRFLHSSF